MCAIGKIEAARDEAIAAIQAEEHKTMTSPAQTQNKILETLLSIEDKLTEQVLLLKEIQKHTWKTSLTTNRLPRG